MRLRAMLGGLSLALTAGWNIANIGAVAPRLADAYGVSLAVVGLFTTALFVTHAALQVPAGRLCDRAGARLVGGGALVVVAASSALALLWREAAFAIAMRFICGIGTAGVFVGGSDYIRTTIGSAVAQGVYGAASMAGGGIALAVIPLWGSWHAPFATAAAVAVLALVLVVIAPREEPRAQPVRDRPLLDRRLLPLAAWHAASFGLSVVIGNWVVTLLERAGGTSARVAGLVGALVLFLGVISRPLGGQIRSDAVLRVSFLTGGVSIALLAAAKPLWLVVIAAAAAGLAAGFPFAPSFSGAARTRPDAPGAAVGLVNMAAAATILVSTPLLGLAFSLPGNGRIGFFAVAVLWAATALTVRRRSSSPQRTSHRA